MQPTQLATIDLNALAKSIGLKEKPEWPHSLFGNDFSPSGHSKVYEIMGMPVVFSKLIYKAGDGHLTGYLKLPEDTTKNIGNMKTQGFGYYDGVVGVVGVDSGHNWNADQTIEEQFKDIVGQIKGTINKIGLGPKQRRYQMPSKLSSELDVVASRLEAMGLIKEAEELDVISNTIDILANSPEIKTIYDETKQLNPEHAATLIGERLRGSKWGENLTEQKLVSLPWEEYRGPKIPGVMQPVARYFKLEDASKYFPGSMQRMESLEDAEKKGYRMSVQQGAHGNKEIVSPDVKDSPIMEAWLIVGPAEDTAGKPVPGKEMIWTLFPGVLSGSDPNWDGVIETIPQEKKKYVAVKGL